MDSLCNELAAALGMHGFCSLADPASTIPGADLLLKRQTWNTNRAIVAVSLPAAPEPMGSFVRRLRRQVAFRCGFFPLIYGIGVQAIIRAPNFALARVDPARLVAFIDNQWAIVQSLFFVDTSAGSFQSARSWGQVITGKYQDAISDVLSRHYRYES